MTVFSDTPGLVEREPVAVMQATCADDIAEIRKLWPWFEERVGLRGRKMYATADLSAQTYSTCTLVHESDDPARLGLEVGELPGRHVPARPSPRPSPGVYGLIGPGFEELEATTDAVDRSRALVEYYRRLDEIELWLPVTT